MDNDKTVIDVVNELKADTSWDFCYAYVGMYENCINANKLQFTQSTVDNNMWKLVCTYDEFNKCVDELSRAEWMTKPVYTQTLSH